MARSVTQEHIKQEEIINAYDELASVSRNRLYECGNYRLMKVLTDYHLLSKIEIADKEILNVGCFVPMDEIQFAGTVRKWAAIDLSPGAIEVATKIVDEELPGHLAQRCTFQVANAGSLPFEDESFDITVSFSTIDHIPDGDVRKRAIEEMARVTRKAGHVIITVPNKLDLYAWYGSSKAQREGRWSCRSMAPWLCNRSSCATG